MATVIFDNCENLFGEQITIASGASVSEGVPTLGRGLCGIYLPASWTAANIAFSVSLDGINFVTVVDSSGNLEGCKVTAGTAVAFPTADALKFPFLRVLSVNTDGSGAAVTQGAARTLTLIFQRFLGGS